MYDINLVIGLLEQIYGATKTIQRRFRAINSVDDFTDTQGGMDMLDGICMLLIAIGESLKKIDKITDRKLLSHYTEIDWKGAKGVRDIISHHYFDIDAEEIFWICSHHLEPLCSTIRKIVEDLEDGATS
ncbi:MAG: DUF86 domain-containing protein [Deltaproteobacteria bacterium]|nr:DUF86 domain-containing protein [Deltaproteobacteria bacterium]